MAVEYYSILLVNWPKVIELSQRVASGGTPGGSAAMAACACAAAHGTAGWRVTIAGE